MGDKIIPGIKNEFLPASDAHYLSRDELFKKLSVQYYGSQDFSEELQLVNKALRIKETRVIKNTDLIIPCYDAIKRLKNKQTVLNLQDQPRENEPDTKNEIAKSKIASYKNLVYNKSSVLEILFLFILISFIIGLFRFLIRNIFWKKQLNFPDKNEKTIYSDDRILLDFDISDFEKKKT